jgi:hypothetical protein
MKDFYDIKMHGTAIKNKEINNDDNGGRIIIIIIIINHKLLYFSKIIPWNKTRMNS